MNLSVFHCEFNRVVQEQVQALLDLLAVNLNQGFVGADI